jgi:hypothetical protein
MSVTLENTAVLVNGRRLHNDGTLMGFLDTSGNWDMYANNGGNVWSKNYGWLHDYFMRTVSNCLTGGGISSAVNCYGGGNIITGATFELLDNGASLGYRTIQSLTNCNCACDCL